MHRRLAFYYAPLQTDRLVGGIALPLPMYRRRTAAGVHIHAVFAMYVIPRDLELQNISTNIVSESGAQKKKRLENVLPEREHISGPEIVMLQQQARVDLWITVLQILLRTRWVIPGSNCFIGHWLRGSNSRGGLPQRNVSRLSNNLDERAVR